jgi:hypothetical protein
MATKKKSKANAKKKKLERKPKSIKAKKVVKSAARKQAAKIVAKATARNAAAVTIKTSVPVSVPTVVPKPLVKPVAKPKTKVKVKPQYTPLTSEERRILRSAQQQFTYMNAPAVEHEFQVGDTVEVFCDHEKNGERVRGWVKGIVVQVDNKLVAVQFRSNVFLTDGWMVPDRILWYPLTSDQIRESGSSRKNNRKEIFDF